MPQYIETGIRLNRETAGTGGIRKITGRLSQGGGHDIEIEGVLLPPIPRAMAPNFNSKLPSVGMIGLPDYEIAHLWGPGFGDEAWDGMMYAPRSVNQEWQNRGIEQRLRDLRLMADRAGATIELVARAASHPLGTHRGNLLLHEVSYRFSACHPQKGARPLGRVEILVEPPPSRRVEVEVSLMAIV